MALPQHVMHNLLVTARINEWATAQANARLTMTHKPHDCTFWVEKHQKNERQLIYLVVQFPPKSEQIALEVGHMQLRGKNLLTDRQIAVVRSIANQL